MKSLRRVMGTFLGSGATVYLCTGAVPIYAKIINITNATNPNFIEWSRHMIGGYLAYGGILCTGSSGIYTKATTAGVYPYEGGDLLTSTNQTSVTAGHAVYLGWDEENYQDDYTYGSGTSGTPINTWTNDGTTTGHFNVDGVSSGCRIGVGSIIRIKENSTGLVKEASIITLTSTYTFSTATYVTLSRTIGSGTITYLSGQYTLMPIAVGKTTPAGLQDSEVTFNVHDEVQVFDFQMAG